MMNNPASLPPSSKGLKSTFPRYFWPLIFLSAFLFGCLQTKGLFVGKIIADERFGEYMAWRFESARQWASGDFPFWTDQVYAGMPLFSTSYSGVLYPPNLLYLIVPPIIAANMLQVIHLMLAMVGMVLYLKSRRLLPVPCFVGACLFVTSNFLLIHQGHVSMHESVCWIPMLAFLSRKLIQKPSLMHAIFLSIALMMQGAAGYFQIVFFSVGWIAIEWVTEMRLSKRFTKATAILTLSGVIGIGILSIQIFTSLGHSEFTPRMDMTLESWADSPFRPWYFILYFWPSAFGNRESGWLGVNWISEELVGLSIIAMPLVFTCLLLVLIRRKNRSRTKSVIVILSAAFISFILAGGTEGLPFYEKLFHVPPFSLFRIPARYMVIPTMALSVIGALGLQLLLRERRSIRSLIFLGSWLAVGAVGILLFIWLADPLPNAASLSTIFSDEPYEIFTLLPILATIILISFARKYRLLIAISFALVLGVEWQLLASAFYIVPDKHRSFLELSENELLSQLPNPEQDLIYVMHPNRDFDTPHWAPFANTGMYLGVRTLNGYCPLMNRDIIDVFKLGAAGKGWEDDRLFWEPISLERIGVTHLLIDESTLDSTMHSVFRGHLTSGRMRVIAHDKEKGSILIALPDSLPKISWSSGYWINNDAWHARHMLEEKRPADGSKQIIPMYGIVNEDIKPELGNHNPENGPIEVLEKSFSSMTLNIKAKESSYLIVRKKYWQGWEFRFSGKNQEWRPVERAWDFLIAIPAPKGESKVELRYRPPGWGKGLKLSLASLGGLLLMILSAWKPLLRRNKKLIQY